MTSRGDGGGIESGDADAEERMAMLMKGGGGESADNDVDDNNNQDNTVQAMVIPVGTDDYKKKGRSRGSTVRRTVSKGPGSDDGGLPAALTGGTARGSRRSRNKPPPPSSSSDHHESPQAKFIKYAALFMLVAQMVGLVLLMRYSRTNRDPNTPLYLASTAVFVMEFQKLIICLIVILYQSDFSMKKFGNEIKLHIFQSPYEILKLCVPSLLYTVQNNLLYLALTNLDAATYQVCYQLKILTTALFSALLLGRKFSKQKWLSLVVLTIGVAIVQGSGSGDQHSSNQHHHVVQHDNEGNAAAQHAEDQQQREAMEAAAAAAAAATAANNRWIGLIAVLCAACTSGFSGVYFEKILKGSRTSLWIRNIQMGLPSTIIAYLTVYFKDATAVQKQGFLGGYTNIVWTVVTVQAVGGLIVAVVVRYADNVLKVFATSFSIVVSCIISAFLFDFHPTMLFLIGASLVVTATVMYSSPDGAPKKRRLKATSSGMAGGIGGGTGTTKGGGSSGQVILPMTATNTTTSK